MQTPRTLSLAIATITLIAAPAAAQDVTATLRIQGDVMVSTGGEFKEAVDGQPILPGQRLMVGDGASATVQFSRDCKRSYSSAGVYTVTPTVCEDDRERQRQDQATEQGVEVASEAGSTLTTVGTILGTVAGIAILLEQADDDPVSR